MDSKDQEDFYRFVDRNKDEFINLLSEWVSIKSVSSDPNHRNDCFKMIEIVEKLMLSNGIATQIFDNPLKKEVLADGKEIDLPPLLTGHLCSHSSFKNPPTVCIYGHLDVQPAKKSDGWVSDPFTLDIRGDQIFGRGATDDKGPVLCWLLAIYTFNKLNIPIPVNVKFLFESMEESGSIGVEKFIKDNAQGFFKDVDYICISDSYWLTCNKPCLTYGLRGNAYFHLEVFGPSSDLHSGVFGGVVHEPLNDLIKILESLTFSDGTIIVAGLANRVLPVSEQEAAIYKEISFNPKEFRESIGVTSLNCHEEASNILMKRWRYPSLSIHGIQGAFDGQGSKTVIPSKVVGKFSIRLVPDMKIQEVEQCIHEHITRVFNTLKSPNKFNLKMDHGSSAWVCDPKNPNYEAAARAIRKVFNVDPDYIREGGSIPIALDFSQIQKKNVLLLPIGCPDDGAHSQNEKINLKNFLNGIKVMGTYLYEVYFNKDHKAFTS